MNDFTDIQQITDNRWQARYHGNYGIYTVKIEFDGNGHRKSFSCTCPSDGYPCKHIGMLQDAIKQQHAKFADKHDKSELTVENILQHVTLDELRDFVVKKAKFSNDLTKAITLEFVEKAKNLTAEDDSENIYKSLIRDDLYEIEFAEEDFYNRYDSEYGEVDLSVLNDWYNKATSFVAQKKFEDAVQVCQAAIEEYSEWYENVGEEIQNNIYYDYQDDFFQLLTEMLDNEQIDKRSIFEYCKQELEETEYSADTRNLFSNLMEKLANAVNPDEFVALQTKLLHNLDNKSSHEAESIVSRLHRFYLSNNQNDKAERLIEDNLQIEKFRKMAVEKRISEKRFDEAKSLITKTLNLNKYYAKSEWNKYLLEIAQYENDIPTIRALSFEFINSSFNKEYYKIYKSTFLPDEWTTEFEKLYQHYVKNCYFPHKSIPELLSVEGLTDRLLEYCEINLSTEIMENFYSQISAKYPQKTLELFKRAVDLYAEKNVGDNHYDAVCRCLKTMKKINGGESVVRQIVDNYLIVYKRRPNMVKRLKKLIELNC